ncbi:MAG: hypothetical protein A2234_11285 [Elusimicrobia bacterium RIFOXYA2_FULL_58_8]|nr:MAG: hypothetical protein A2285_02865 [Elusimicrobia bacterium RIFOXYA12_FULL_57_11]OGS14522.1 MAG: hypothetical protein A2234_11285 [Elusimicrobia bacterium RIFOXYA2_FULL_58_8]
MHKHHALEQRKWVRLTRACNNRCLFCLDCETQDGSFVPLREVEAELRSGLKKGCRRVVLSGGEPTLHPDFVEIVRLASGLGYPHVQVITNGRMFCYADLLGKSVKAGLSEITFSLHGLTAASHDMLVGARGAFAQTVSAISAAVKTPGLIVSSDIVVNRQNVDELADIIRLLYGLGVREYDLLQIMPVGRAWKYWRRLGYDAFKKKSALDKALAWASVPGIHLWTNRFSPARFEGREELIQSPEKLMDEILGRAEMFRAFLREGVRMVCAGARCRYCVLELFCSDLKELRARGRLGRRPAALCLVPARRAARGGVSSHAPVSGPAAGAEISARAGLKAIGAFFVKCRYVVKGGACQSCGRGRECAGADIQYVIRRGFRALFPFSADTAGKRSK